MRTLRTGWLLSGVLSLGASVWCAPSSASAQAAAAATDSPVDAGAPVASEAPRATVESVSPAESAEALSSADLSAVDALLAGATSGVSSLESDGPSVHVYGFADFNVSRPYISKDSALGSTSDRAAFAIGNVNVYLASNLTHGFSSLIEVRLTYMPSGSFDPTGQLITTYAADAASYGQEERWGGIVLQRVHLDYSYNGLLNVRVGQFLTPYGIWNVDHGSPTIIPVLKPYPIGSQFFPERQVGAEVFGTHLVKNTTLGYHLTLSNGRGDIETSDFDKNKAVGARIFAANDAFGSLKVGLSAYGGRATQEASLGLAGGLGSGGGLGVISGNQYDEFALAADLLWQWKNLHIQGEGIVTQVRYTEAGRHLVTTLTGTPVGLAADHVAWGWYGLIGYRLPWLSTMPFVLIDQLDKVPGAGRQTPLNVASAIGYNVGLNVRPIPSVVLKCQVGIARATSNEGFDATLVTGQAAWAF